MLIGKRTLLESRSISVGSTSESFNHFSSTYRVYIAEISGLDESGANIAMRYNYATSFGQDSNSKYRHSYTRINNTNNSSYVQATAGGITNRHYDWLWKGGNSGTIIFFDPFQSKRTMAIAGDMRYNAHTFGYMDTTSSYGGFRLYNDAGGNFNSANAVVKIFGVDLS